MRIRNSFSFASFFLKRRLQAVLKHDSVSRHMHISLFNFAEKGRGNIAYRGTIRQRWWGGVGGGIWLSLKATRRRVFAICMHNLLSVCDAAYY